MQKSHSQDEPDTADPAYPDIGEGAIYIIKASTLLLAQLQSALLMAFPGKVPAAAAARGGLSNRRGPQRAKSAKKSSSQRLGGSITAR